MPPRPFSFAVKGEYKMHFLKPQITSKTDESLQAQFTSFEEIGNNSDVQNSFSSAQNEFTLVDEPEESSVPTPKKLDKQKTVYFVILLGYYIGLVTGSMLLFSEPASTFFAYYWRDYAVVLTMGAFFKTFSTLLWGAAIPFAIQLFLSFCFFSAPFLIVMPYLNGVYIGLFAANLYANYALKGALVNMILFLPFSCVLTALQMFMCAKAFLFSLSLLKFYRKSLLGEESTPPSAMRLVKRYGVCLLVVLAVVGVQVFVLKWFAPALL